MNRIPKEFLKKMESLLEVDYPAFTKALQQSAERGLRINTNKISVESFLASSPFQLTPVPWTTEGFYYQHEERPGKHPYHAAGLYYIQEPSAMSVAAILDPKPGEKVLDLAAAPGGKATHCAALMKNEGLLIANEIHPQRAKALSENFERLGITCGIVTNEAPDRLAKRFPQYFDAILLDAPCSGEGMFRKDEQACDEWGLQQVEFCASRQKEILDIAATMLKPGGRLVYSTCTFSPEENEQVIEQFLEGHPDWSIVPIEHMQGFAPGRTEWTISKRRDLQYSVRLWPHLLRGEGHFVALLRKSGNDEPMHSAMSNRKKLSKNKELESNLSYLKEFVSTYLTVPWDHFAHQNIKCFGTHLYALPDEDFQTDSLKILRAGLHLGEIKKKRFEPSHALAMALTRNDFTYSVNFSSDLPETTAYLRGESIPYQGSSKGWCAILVDGYPLGWAKASDGILKNHYPKGLRILS